MKCMIYKLLLKLNKNIYLDSKVAFTGDKTDMYESIRTHGFCDIVFLQEEYFFSGMGIALRQGAPYKEAFDRLWVQWFTIST